MNVSKDHILEIYNKCLESGLFDLVYGNEDNLEFLNESCVFRIKNIYEIYELKIISAGLIMPNCVEYWVGRVPVNFEQFFEKVSWDVKKFLIFNLYLFKSIE